MDTVWDVLTGNLVRRLSRGHVRACNGVAVKPAARVNLTFLHTPPFMLAAVWLQSQIVRDVSWHPYLPRILSASVCDLADWHVWRGRR